VEGFSVSFTNILIFLSLEFLLLEECFLWVLGYVGGAVKVGNFDIYNGIGSVFENATNGVIACVVVCVGGSIAGAISAIVNDVLTCVDGCSWSGGKVWFNPNG
jgi:hypothetical protein